MALTKIKGAGVNISATEKLYFDDGGNTYIYESGADVLDIYVGGANMVKLTESTTDTVTVTGNLTVGVDGTGHDVKFFGDTASAYMLWDQSADDLILSGTAQLSIDTATDASNTTTGSFHTDGGVGIAKKLYVGTDLDVDGTANLDAVDIDGAVQIDNTITVGADAQGYDVIFYGDTASSNMTWDTSADDLILNDARIFIDQDDNAQSIYVDSEADENAVEIYGKYGLYSQCDVSGGRAAYFTRNIAESGSLPCVSIIDNHTSNTQPALQVQQDGAGRAISIDQNGNNPAIYIDTEATGQHGIIFDAPTQTTGSLFLINDCDAITSGSAMQVQCASANLATTANAGLIMVNYTGASTSASNLLYLKNDHASADATVGLKIKQDGAAASIELEGNGSIKFPGTQGASSDANSLDDYEEGTWTAALTCTTSGTITINTSYDTLHYTKIGRIVHIIGYFNVSAISSPVGALRISLPFTSAALAEEGGDCAASIRFNGLVSNNVADAWAHIARNSAFMDVYMGDSNSLQSDAANQIDTGSDMRISATYIAA